MTPIPGPYFRETWATRRGWMPNRLMLETSFLPCIDFDGPIQILPPGAFRSYETSQGHRVFLTDRVEPVSDLLLNLFTRMGADPKYVGFCRSMGFYRMRVSPKQQEELLPRQAICRLHAQRGPIRPEWEAFLARHDELCLRPDALVLV